MIYLDEQSLSKGQDITVTVGFTPGYYFSEGGSYQKSMAICSFLLKFNPENGDKIIYIY